MKSEEKRIKTALRYQALYIPDEWTDQNQTSNGDAAVFTAALSKLGFGLREEAFAAVKILKPESLGIIADIFQKIMGVRKNWTPMIKNWIVPTGVSAEDHLITLFANVFGAEGTEMPCGHMIPDGTFPLERYNGCPFCGTPFEFGEIEYKGQGSKLKILELWKEDDLDKCLAYLLESRTALDVTQMDSLLLLLSEFPLSDVEIKMKETRMAVLDHLLKKDKRDEFISLMKTPADLMRYLWFKHTGFFQLVRPKTVRRRKRSNARALYFLKTAEKVKEEMKEAERAAKNEIKLKFSRNICLLSAEVLNRLELKAETAAEIMHPHRGMWVRFIRALRLSEYAKKDGFEKLKKLLDVFYNESYEVWAGRLEKYRKEKDPRALELLKERPGVFS